MTWTINFLYLSSFLSFPSFYSFFLKSVRKVPNSKFIFLPLSFHIPSPYLFPWFLSFPTFLFSFPFSSLFEFFFPFAFFSFLFPFSFPLPPFPSFFPVPFPSYGTFSIFFNIYYRNTTIPETGLDSVFRSLTIKNIRILWSFFFSILFMLDVFHSMYWYMLQRF